MISIKYNKKATVLTTITVFASIMIASMLAIGNAHSALAASSDKNSGVNESTDTNQKTNCESAGGTSSVSNACSESSSDSSTESGGIIHK